MQNVELVFLNTDNFDSVSNMYNLNVNISWEAPSNPNGVILGYNYSLMEASNSNVIIGYTNTTLLSAEHNVMVAPFTNYIATVVAFTSAGGGEPVMDVALSPEASKFIWWWYIVLDWVVVMLLSVRYLHSAWPSTESECWIYSWVD